MPGYFLDTSALNKHYHVEVGTADVDAIFRDPNAQVYISRLAFVEFRSAFARKVRNNQTTPANFQHVCIFFEDDIAHKVIKGIRFRDSNFQQAITLIDKYGLTQNLRTFRCAATCYSFRGTKKGKIDYFVCADRALCSIAQAEGLSVINPVP